MRARLLAEAEAELLDAAQWYENHRIGLGLEFYESVLTTCQALGRAPLRFPVYEGALVGREVRRALVDRFPFAVIFEVRKDEVLIVAVAHTSREPGYWIDR